MRKEKLEEKIWKKIFRKNMKKCENFEEKVSEFCEIMSKSDKNGRNFDEISRI